MAQSDSRNIGNSRPRLAAVGETAAPGAAAGPTISPTSDIIADIRNGKMVILVDEEDRENEGDLILAADFVSAEHINFMAHHGRGLICLTLTEARCRQLNLPLMVANNRSSHGTNFTVTIEAAEGVTTGISAQDRARTVKAAVAPDAKPSDLVQPGHIFPLMAQNGGVLMRAGHTEAGSDLAAMAGLTPATVICEILREDGTMARLPDLVEFGGRHGLKIGTIADLIHYRSQNESLVLRAGEREIATAHGTFRLVAYTDKATGGTHLALTRGAITRGDETLVRVHEPLSVVDLLDKGPGTHSWGIDAALAAIARAGRGVMVFLNCQDAGRELIERSRVVPGAEARRAGSGMDLRTYGIGAQILRDLGVGRMRLLAAPRKMPSMAGFGLEVCGYQSHPERE
jgi:3,4-dihydroxy 2-butanone 4-phosphate synthase / GTP cyclohydrolase II